MNSLTLFFVKYFSSKKLGSEKAFSFENDVKIQDVAQKLAIFRTAQGQRNFCSRMEVTLKTSCPKKNKICCIL
jgi:hypothetical protein